MNLTLLFPRSRHYAVEDSYGTMQTRLLLARQTAAARLLVYDAADLAAEVLNSIDTEMALIVTDPRIIAGPDLVEHLARALADDPAAAAAVPAIAGQGSETQHRDVQGSLTLRQFEGVAIEVASTGATGITTWGREDPGIALVRVDPLRGSGRTLDAVLEGRRVIVDSHALAFRFSPQRGFLREDLLSRITDPASSVLDLGCGEGALGAAIKARHPCRVVGVEIDRDAASIAATRLDEVHGEDARSVVPALRETFDWIVGGDVVEHVEDPWRLLSDLHRVTHPGSRLLLSVPNVGCWPVVADLLVGRFDYTFAGILCAGHLRFFTRRTIEDLLAMSGWVAESIEASSELRTADLDDVLSRLSAAGIPHSPDDLAALGFHVLARAKTGSPGEGAPRG